MPSLMKFANHLFGISIFLCYQFNINALLQYPSCSDCSSCNGNTNVLISSYENFVNDYAFEFCYSLTTVIVPSSIIRIGVQAFKSCESLSYITLPDTLVSIDDSAFYGCASLKTIDLPFSLVSLGNNAFSGCSSLDCIKWINNTIISMGSNVFLDCPIKGCTITTSLQPSLQTSASPSTSYPTKSIASSRFPSSSLNPTFKVSLTPSKKETTTPTRCSSLSPSKTTAPISPQPTLISTTKKPISPQPTILSTKAPISIQPTLISTSKKSISPQPTLISTTKKPISPQPTIFFTKAPISIQPTLISTSKKSTSPQPTKIPSTKAPISPQPTIFFTKAPISTQPTLISTTTRPISLPPTIISTSDTPIQSNTTLSSCSPDSLIPCKYASYNIGTVNLIDIWVDPIKGLDTNTGNSRNTAVKTVYEAWRRIPSLINLSIGYRMQLVNGTYDSINLVNYWENRWGTKTNPIILNSVDGNHKALFTNDMNVYNTKYLYIIGVDIKPNHDAIHFEQCSYILLRSMELSGGNYQARDTFKANQCDHVYIEDCNIHGADFNAIQYVAVQYGHIKGNRVYNAHDWCIYTKGGSAYIELSENEIYNCGKYNYKLKLNK